jgi:hypothetical protein
MPRTLAPDEEILRYGIAIGLIVGFAIRQATSLMDCAAPFLA